jgi:hypothetical protein
VTTPTKQRPPGGPEKPPAGPGLLAAVHRYKEAERAAEGAVDALEAARAEVVAAFRAAGLEGFHYGPWR